MSDYSALTLGYHLSVYGGGATAQNPRAVLYSAVLTGSADSTTDLNLPIDGFALLLYASRTSTVTIYCPWSSDLIADVAARPNGDLTIRKTWILDDGTSGPTVDIATFDYDALSYTRGPVNASITLTGSTTYSNPAPKTSTIADLFTERKNAGGAREWSIPLSYSVDPDDSVVIDAETITIEKTSITANEREAFQTIQEPDP